MVQVNLNQHNNIEMFSIESLSNTKNIKVMKIVKRLNDPAFFERISSYHEHYWDDHHSQTW